MKKLLLLCVLLFTASILFAQISGTITDISGKVSVRTGTNSWQKAAKGMAVTSGMSISTGFRSLAIIDLGDSELKVKALTRMNIDELVKKEGTVKTGLSLDVGRVSAKVKRRQGLNHDFKVRSPVATAAVRGTEFEFTPYGVDVTEGIVSFANQLQQQALVRAGGVGKITGNGGVIGGADALSLAYSVSPNGDITVSLEGVTSGNTGSVAISWD